MSSGTDIDIDVANRDQVLSGLDVVFASMLKDGELVRHNTGVYLQNMPMNPFMQTASIDYENAEERGYMKLDVLNVHIYKDVRDEAHLVRLMKKEPNWKLLESADFVKDLFQLSNYHDLLVELKPSSIPELAAMIAIIRPGKKHLQNRGWDTIMKEVWKKSLDESEYFFKKSHSFSYAVAVAVHMNLLEEKLHLTN